MSTTDNLLDFEAKQGEKISITKTLYGADGNPAPLAGLAVKFNMRPRGKGTALIARAACTVVDPNLGIVSFTSAASDTAAVSGFVEAEFLTLNGTTVVNYFPDGKDEYLLGFITPAIA